MDNFFATSLLSSSSLSGLWLSYALLSCRAGGGIG